MGFSQAVRSCLDKYADFNGRAPRSEYWFFNLAYFLAALAIVALAFAAGAAGGPRIGVGLGIILLILLGVGILVPHLAVSVRRLHDINMSGWLYLLIFVPFGSIAIFVFTVIPGTRGANRYGPDPFENVADVFS